MLRYSAPHVPVSILDHRWVYVMSALIYLALLATRGRKRVRLQDAPTQMKEHLPSYFLPRKIIFILCCFIGFDIHSTMMMVGFCTRLLLATGDDNKNYFLFILHQSGRRYVARFVCLLRTFYWHFYMHGWITWSTDTTCFIACITHSLVCSIELISAWYVDAHWLLVKVAMCAFVGRICGRTLNIWWRLRCSSLPLYEV